MSNVTLESYLIVGAVLFVLGMVGFLTRRNLIIMFLSAEMMLQGVSINLVAFAHFRGDLGGQVLVLFILAVAACEAAIALALVLMLYKRSKTLDVSIWQELREPEVQPIEDDDPLAEPDRQESFEHLTPSGVEPADRKDAREASHV